jgi:hypothetical protein
MRFQTAAEITAKAERSAQLFDIGETRIDDGQRQTRVIASRMRSRIDGGVLRASLERPMAATIHVVPDDSFDDWVVRDDSGREFGHYPTRETAELVAQAVARKSGAEIIIHLPDGRTNRKNFTKGARWLQG